MTPPAVTDAPQDGDTRPTVLLRQPLRRRRSTLFWLAAILLLAALLRCYRADAPLWWDELVSIEAANGRALATELLPRGTLIKDPPSFVAPESALPVHRIWTSLEREANPPLYYVLLRLWLACFGYGDLAARALSIALGVATVGFTFGAARERSSDRGALTAALVVAVSITGVFYAQEVRAYALMACLTALAIWLAERWTTRGRTAAVVVGLAATLLSLPLSHYYAIAPAAAVVVYLLLTLRGRDRLYAFVAAMAALLAFAMVWGPWLLRLQIDPQRHVWLQDTTGNPVPDTLIRLAAAPSRLLLSLPPAYFAWLFWSILLLVAPLLLWRRLPALRLPGFVALFVIALPAARDLVDGTVQLHHVRYIVAAVPAMAIIVAALLGLVRSRQLQMLSIVVLFAAMATAYHPRLHPQRKEWSELIDALRAVRPSDAAPLVIISDPTRYQSNIGPLMALQRYAPEQVREIVLTEQSGGPPLPTEAVERGEMVLLFCVGTQPLRPPSLREWTVARTQRIPANAPEPDFTVMHLRRP